MSARQSLPDQVADFCRLELQRQANPAKALQMAAYMKTEMPFYGVQKPDRNDIIRSIKKQYPIFENDLYRDVVDRLWRLPHREEKYLAVQLAQSYPKSITQASMDLYERLIREGAWWDFVDDIAIRLVGRVLLDERAEVSKFMDRWVDDNDLWIRRTAIIFQIKHKERTDHRRLFSYCERRSSEAEFFIRKGIGWALREYSKTDPDRVFDFLQRNGDRLSGLSYREGARRLKKLGYDLSEETDEG